MSRKGSIGLDQQRDGNGTTFATSRSSVVTARPVARISTLAEAALKPRPPNSVYHFGFSARMMTLSSILSTLSVSNAGSGSGQPAMVRCGQLSAFV